jgi:outer membrane protein TolC
MLAQHLCTRLRRSILPLSSLYLLSLLWSAPVYAQATPQDVDATIGKINQVLKNPAKLLDNKQKTKKSTPSGSVRTYQESVPKNGRLDQTPVQLVEEPAEPENKNPEVLTDVLQASITKTETLPITLEAVLKLVEEQSLPIRHDQLNTRLQKTLYYRSLAEMLPDIAGSHSQTRFNGGTQIFGSQIMTFTRVQINPMITASWTIKPGGEDVFKALAARRRATGSRSLLESTKQEQLAAAAQDYYNLIQAQVELENIKIAIEEAQNQVSMNESRLKAGVGTKLDVMRAKSQLVSKERDLIMAETARSKAEQALLTRLNLDTDISLSTEGAFAQPHLLVPLKYSTEELVAIAKKENPAVSQTEAEIAALKAEAKSILSRVIPSVTLQTYVQATGPSFDVLSKGTYIGMNIQAGLFSKLGSAIPLDYKAKALQIQQKENELQALKRSVEQAVIQSYLDSRQAAKAILTAWQELEVSEEAYRLAVGRFKAGLGINVDVLDAQTALNTARTNVAQATTSFNQAQVNLLKALGQVSKDTLLNGLKNNVAITPVSSSKAKK